MVRGVNSLYYSMLSSQRTSNYLWCNIPVKGIDLDILRGGAQSDMYV